MLYNSVKIHRINKLGSDNYIGIVLESSIDEIKVKSSVLYRLFDKKFISTTDDQQNIDIVRPECIFEITEVLGNINT